MKPPIPLPGSPEARLLGCTCPVMGNRGRPREWRIVNGGCPVHAAPTCKCGIREKLVGDGCSVCNPEYVAEHGDEEPTTPENNQEINLRASLAAIHYWARMSRADHTDIGFKHTTLGMIAEKCETCLPDLKKMNPVMPDYNQTKP